jgi:hypothetical protein
MLLINSKSEGLENDTARPTIWIIEQKGSEKCYEISHKIKLVNELSEYTEATATGSMKMHLAWLVDALGLVNNEINNQQPKSKDLKNFLSLPPLNFSTTVKLSPLGMSSSIYSFSFISLSPRTVASS